MPIRPIISTSVSYTHLLAAVRVNLTASMDSYLSTLKLKLRKAREVESQTLDRIESVPQQEKKALGIIRQQSIKESLYTFLLNKREENALQLAIDVYKRQE